MQKLVLFFFLPLLLFCSCSIEKRHYTTGFYLHKKPNIDFSAEEKNEPILIQANISTRPGEEQSMPVILQDSLPLNETAKQPLIVCVGSMVLKSNENEMLTKEEKSSLKHSSEVVSDTTHKSKVKQNKKEMADSDETEEYFLGTNIMFSFCLLMIAFFVFNPTLGMLWLTACLFGPMAIICSFMSIYCLLRAAYELIQKWYSPSVNKKIGWLMAWTIFNLFIAVLLALMLIAMFA